MKKRAIYLNKFVAISMSFIILFSLLFLILSAMYIERTGIEIGKSRQAELSSLVSTEVEAELYKLTDISSVLMNDSRLITKFSELSTDYTQGNYFDKNLLDSIEYSTILASTNSTKPPLWRICIYNANGDFLYTGAACTIDSVSSQLKQTQVQKLMYTYSGNAGRYDLIQYDDDVWGDVFHSEYVVLRRPLMNIYSNSVYGIIELSTDIRVFRQILDSHKADGVRITILDDDKNVIVASGEINSAKKEIIVASPLINSDWQVSISQTTEVMMKPYRRLMLFVCIGVLILAVGACFVIYMVSVRLSRPLLELKKTVGSISYANREIIRSDNAHNKTDEIKELDAAFGAMLNRLNNSMMLEKKASMLALQSQMNPHFLFNTLSVIGATGGEDGSERVEKLCSLLCAMLRYSASYEESSVKLCDEVEYLEDYLRLMKARYEDFLKYNITVSQDALDLTVPKMLLQPLVENSFTHGFVNREPPYEVNVSISIADPDKLKIEISDNGCGFSEQEISFINERVKRLEKEVSENLSSTSIGGLGLASAVLRMKLLSGKAIRLEIRNLEPHGANVVIEEAL